MPEVAVYCASADSIGGHYRQAARELGLLLADAGLGLVYGGGNVGLMAELARAVHERGGHVAGYIPEKLMAIEGRAYDIADELVVTETMQERKRSMFTRADAFAVLAGGLGTLEEFLEVLTLRQLGYHQKPIVLVNTGGYWDGLLQFFEHARSEGFAPRPTRLFHVAADAREAVDHLKHALQ